jgi:DNA-binding winged helix-turn-helix (wHTH) protein
VTEISMSERYMHALDAENGGVETRDDAHEGELELADQDLRQGLRLIVQACDLLAAGRGIAGERMPPQAASRAIFAGGHALSFGPFQLFPSQRLLVEGNRRVPIGSRAFEILTILVRRAGEVVGKDELIAQVWPSLFVSDCNLKTQIHALRRALGGTSDGGCYIVTVHGRGYNFVAPVSVVAGPALDGPDPRQARGHDHLCGDAQQLKALPMLALAELTRVLNSYS